MSNSEIWDKLSKTDPSQTKGFSRSGGFKGTAIKPMWVWKRLTELFGPVGKGWGMDKPTFQIVPGENKEVLVYCTVMGWYLDENKKCDVFGVGGDKVVTHIKANPQYNKPERWDSDDEAFKKAYTDALMNAFKFVGVGADVHMGLFDDNKYVQGLKDEFAEEMDAKDLPTPENSAQARKAGIWDVIVQKFAEAKTVDELDKRYKWFLSEGKVPHGWRESYIEEYDKRREAIIEDGVALGLPRESFGTPANA